MEQEQQYIQGFNNGYLISKYKPELSDKLSSSLSPQSDFLDGFISGKEEAQIEKSQSILNEIENLRNNSERGNELVRG